MWYGCHFAWGAYYCQTMVDEGEEDILENIAESLTVNLNPTNGKDKCKEYEVKQGKSRVNLT